MSTTARINHVDRWLKDGGSICPWARSAPLTYLIPGSVDLQVRELRQFAARQDQGALIMVAPIDLNELDYLEVVCWARKAFCELTASTVRATVPEIDQLELDRIVQRTSELLCDPNATTRPYLGLFDRPLYTICMAPMYSEGHPRWAPHPMLVATFVDDVARAKRRSEAAVRTIRDKMVAATRSIYDANELVLNLPKEPA